MNFFEPTKRVLQEKIDILQSYRTDFAFIEFTSRCNLRCVYCAVSQPKYKGLELNLSDFEELINSLKKRNVKTINVNGHGETTIVKNWNSYCDRLLDSGFSLNIISNFSRQLSDEEAYTLARFSHISISCDTVNPTLFRTLRRGGDLPTILVNMAKLKGAALKNKLPDLFYSWSCVVTDKNVFELDDYVCFGLALGVKRFTFCNLTKYEDVEGETNVYHVSTLEKNKLHKAYEMLYKCFQIIEDNKCTYYCMPGLIETIKEKLEGEQIQKLEHEQQFKRERTRYSEKPNLGETRDCLDPGNLVYIHSDNSVTPCCWHESIGSLSNGESLEQVLNGKKIKQLREELLTGNLNSSCVDCPARGLVPVGKFKLKVFKNFLKQLSMLAKKKAWTTGISQLKYDCYITRNLK